MKQLTAYQARQMSAVRKKFEAELRLLPKVSPQATGPYPREALEAGPGCPSPPRYATDAEEGRPAA